MKEPVLSHNERIPNTRLGRIMDANTGVPEYKSAVVYPPTLIMSVKALYQRL